MVDPGLITSEPFRARFRCSHGHEWTTEASAPLRGIFAFDSANGHPPDMLCLRCLRDLLNGKVGLVERLE